MSLRQDGENGHSSDLNFALYILKSGELLFSGYFYPENTSVVGMRFGTSLKTQLAGPSPKGLTAVATHMPFAEAHISSHCPLVPAPAAKTPPGEDKLYLLVTRLN